MQVSVNLANPGLLEIQSVRRLGAGHDHHAIPAQTVKAPAPPLLPNLGGTPGAPFVFGDGVQPAGPATSLPGQQESLSGRLAVYLSSGTDWGHHFPISRGKSPGASTRQHREHARGSLVHQPVSNVTREDSGCRDTNPGNPIWRERQHSFEDHRVELESERVAQEDEEAFLSMTYHELADFCRRE